MPELTDHVHAEIKRLCDALAERRDYPKDLRTYWAAWDMLPEPKIQREAAT